ncbi:endopeptidase La [Endozoicomonas sp. OPT23]|uniref:endopeptidase La n=1 Tax=Endozoicomonas sp. OPT23 TaxID=2072845 RepID=UPI00129AAC46|nr:endopeptidase La [Endozoicomonas sp. OPT23]MRI34990.1 endopeptidase La [Endozoicomonas sp. OPT23]
MAKRNKDQDHQEPEVISADESTNDTEELDTEEQSNTELMLPEQALPDKLYLIPVSNRPFFPAQVQPLVFNSNDWEETLQRVSQSPQKVVGLSYVAGLPGNTDDIDPDDFPEIGCTVKIHNIVNESDQIQFIALGMQRFRIKQWLRRRPPYLVQVEYPESKEDDTDEIKAYALALIQAIKELIPLNPLYSEELKNYLNRFSPKDPSPLSDFAAAITTASGMDLQEVLETLPVQRRMEKVLTLIRKEQEVARLQGEINDEVNRKISKHQREFFLKEQLKVIQKELGLSKDDKTAELETFSQRLEGLNVPEAALKKIKDELKKLAILEIGSPEYGICRNYLDWATSIPWGKYSDDLLDLKHAREVLNGDHDGLEDVKDRIVEFLAVGAYKNEVAGSIMLLTGPPGVGKTSIGKSVAKALGRKFYRFSLGGMRDEAEIKGHRRTYVGAMPGKFVQALKEVGVANPVIMLDEIDKIGASFRGDPASALLEVLDPEQNSEFLDHYLDMRIDLSKALFICTANQMDTIPGPLLDRMDIIRLSGYITEEKLAIAKNHLWPKQLQRAGLKKSQIRISDATMRAIIEGYARESGVRHLEKLLQKVIRKVVVRFLEEGGKSLSITTKNLSDFLGSPYFRKDPLIQGIGVVTGLAWTSMGGATLPVEASLIHQHRAGFKLTGKLGDVMKESAEISYSYIASHAGKYGIKPEFFEKAFIHLHVPEGATPKDGPSAGITMATAILSLASRKKPAAIAMTGELTLTGRVLAVGGIREKIIAARRQGIKTLIVPEDCRRDWEELPDYIRDGVTIHFAKTFDDVYSLAFPEKPAGKSKGPSAAKKTIRKRIKK